MRMKKTQDWLKCKAENFANNCLELILKSQDARRAENRTGYLSKVFEKRTEFHPGNC